ncbi:hypothetical protein [Nocardia brevicatena]|uniref:hypothetical protein n=1 Tax=Nocardia brevicatena TaxID=37327 RepID=UPI00031E112C|nr:hypothetical protein [Nocardia brevicatena]
MVQATGDRYGLADLGHDTRRCGLSLFATTGFTSDLERPAARTNVEPVGFERMYGMTS